MSEVELFYEPVQILSRFHDEDTAEMEEGQLAFLCGLIKKYAPKKIVEIGVAAGGTTSVILNCIHMLGLKSGLFSIDLSEDFYSDSSKRTGYLSEECKTMLGAQLDHTMHTGKYAVECVYDVGEGIDFLILDTVHSLPGELLDFLAYCPYLKKGGVVVLHDTALNHYSASESFESFATRVLFSAVAASKMSYRDMNIAAFIVSDDTVKYIGNVFSALMITWKYMPSQKELLLYRHFYAGHYSGEDLEMFDAAVRMNQNTMQRKESLKSERFVKEFSGMYRLISGLRGKRVYVYGCGNFGRQFYHILKECGIELGGYIVSDGQSFEGNNEKICFLSDIVLNDVRDIIFVGVNNSLQEEICGTLREKGIVNYVLPEQWMFDYLRNS